MKTKTGKREGGSGKENNKKEKKNITIFWKKKS